MNIRYDTSKLPPFSLLEEPLLTFNPEDTLLDVNPLRGIVQNGAYSSSIFPTYTPELRIATIGPVSRWKKLRNLVDTLRSNHAPTDRKQYVQDFVALKTHLIFRWSQLKLVKHTSNYRMTLDL